MKLLLGLLLFFFNKPHLKKKLIHLRERDRETLICCTNYLCIHWMLPVVVLTRDRTPNLRYGDGALTNWAAQPGPLIYI